MQEEEISEQAPEMVSEQIDLVEIIHVPEWKSILIDLVKSEKMDPWDIDISELAEKYLQKIKGLKELSLRLPANAILASAILLRFKAKKLRLSSLEEIEELSQQEIDAIKKSEKLYDLFEPELSNPRMQREKRVTLDDLVFAIEKMLNTSRTRPLSGRALDAEFVVPHSGEDIEKKTEEAYALITASLDSTGMCIFSQISAGKPASKVLDLFISILFLCNRQKITAWQDEFWGEIFVSVLQ